jgi:hypothetical protein
MRQDEQNVNLEEIKSKSDEYPGFLLLLSAKP